VFLTVLQLKTPRVDSYNSLLKFQIVKNLVLTSPTSGVRSVCIVRSRTQAKKFSFFLVLKQWAILLTARKKGFHELSLLEQLAFAMPSKTLPLL
jgi:hypothetical protein